MVTAVIPEPPEAANPVTTNAVVRPAGTRTGLNTRNSGMVAMNATAVPARDRPASNNRKIADWVAKTAVITSFIVGFGRLSSFLFLKSTILSILSGKVITKKNILNGKRSGFMLV